MSYLVLVSGTTAANGVPSAATDGVPVRKYAAGQDIGQGFTDNVKDGLVTMRSTAGSGTLTLSYVRIWGYLSAISTWFPLGNGTDANKGKLNDAASFTEVGTDLLLHEEPIHDFGHFDRLYAEVGSFGGTSTAVEVAIHSRD